MTIWEKASSLFQQEIEKKENPYGLVLGPLSLLCTLAVAMILSSTRWDLLFIGAVGFYLSARWHLRGCFYALVLLIIGGLLHHLLLQGDHFLELGIEVSIAFSFFITALSFEESTSKLASYEAGLEIKEETILNLEEDLSREKEEKAASQVALQEKMAVLQKELEELQTQHNSLYVLNDVLRKTSQRYLEEKASVEKKVQETICRTAILQGELTEAKKELARVSNESALAQQNRTLFDEINAARFEKEQAKEINTTLVRLHAKEALKVKEAEKRLEGISAERSFLKERLQAAEFELQHAQTQVRSQNARGQIEVRSGKEDHQTEVRSQNAEVRSGKEDHLYRQLKKQFEEKNQILHETRAELFRTDTALQALKIECEQKEHFFPREMEKEVEKLEEEVSGLQKENRELLEIVSVLNIPSGKKKE